MSEQPSRGLSLMADAFEAGVYAASLRPAERFIICKNNADKVGFFAGLAYARRDRPANDEPAR